MHDPFKIIQPTCISFSGGRTSAYMLWRVLQANGGLPADTVVCFANTGKEVEATLRFVRDCAERWQMPIHWLEYLPMEPGFMLVDFERASRQGEPFEALIRKRQYLPNPVARGCTPSNNMPFGGSSPGGALPETKTARRCSIHFFRRLAPATSLKRAVSYS